MKHILYLLVVALSLTATAQQNVITNKKTDKYTTTADNKISLKLPADYVPLPGTNGFMQGKTGSETITIGDVNQSYITTQAAFTVQAMKDNGMEEIGREEMVINKMSATLIKVKQHTGLSDIIKYILVIGNDAITFVINGQYAASTPEKDQVLRDILLSVVYNAPGK